MLPIMAEFRLKMHHESGVALYWSVQQLEECFSNPFLDNSYYQPLSLRKKSHNEKGLGFSLGKKEPVKI